MSLVIDASVALAWCFDDETTPFSLTVLQQLRETAALVPAVWPLEIANVLLIGERRGRLTSSQEARFLALLQELPIAVDEETNRRAWGSILATGRTTGLTAYDAAYLELAMRSGFALATHDQSLRTAARHNGVIVLE